MGNTESVHNLHSDCINNDLNSFCTQQYLRRASGEPKKKFNQVVLGGGWSSGKRVADCKVLSKPTENLKLRATTNGAILQAGGTIRFRAKEQLDLDRTNTTDLERVNKPGTFHPMRRCHTLIFDGKNESKSQRKSDTSLIEFRRSQTLLHISYNSTKAQSTSLGKFNGSSQLQPPNTPAASTLKVNKYNKKRKAPPAPPKLESVGLNNATSAQSLSNERRSASRTKPRIYTTNSNKIPVLQKQQQQVTHSLESQPTKNLPFQRDSKMRTSIVSERKIQQSTPSSSSRLPFRREKSFDAVLLRQRDTNDCTDKKLLAKSNNLPITPMTVSKLADDSQKKKLRQPDNVKHTNNAASSFINAYHPELTFRDTHKTVEWIRTQEPSPFALNREVMREYKIDNKTEIHSLANEKKVKYQQSRISQLKRTFYFGMESPTKSPAHHTSHYRNVTYRCIVIPNHNIEPNEKIIDNGILVHVRPTLPRRQPETPSFSPAAAWRNLLEEQQRLQQERLKQKQNTFHSRVTESPICLASDPKQNNLAPAANWTPQQDLEDDDDEGNCEQKCKTTKLAKRIEIDSENHSKPLHVFSLSLPRDVHLQCQTKFPKDFAGQENSFKTENCWLVPGFNSLQKFKTHLAGSKVKHLPDCELNKTPPKSPNYHNDNWLLHKSKSNNSSLETSAKETDQNCLESPYTLQPKSLTNICGGKHIVYLPGQSEYNICLKSNPKNPKHNKKAAKSTYKRQRQRHGIIRESLQDLTPVQNIHQSNVNTPEKNTNRFSFQSTVRILEKRRLAEKLSRDAEIQEAQRLNELEAMKRVEEDFQRKRVPEKANIRNQLRLHLHSLPLNINERHSDSQYVSDLNNNSFCRAEPDGAVSPSLGFNDSLSRAKNSKELKCFVFDLEGSESDTQVPNLQHTALLIEPYLHSII